MADVLMYFESRSEVRTVAESSKKNVDEGVLVLERVLPTAK